MKSLLINLIAFSSLILFVSGCGGKNKSKNIIENKTKTPVEENSTIIKKLNTDLLKKIIQDRNGKILIVNLWSTWSGKSMNQLLILNDVYEKYKNDLADFLVVTIDTNPAIESKDVPFIKKENIKFPVYMIDSGNGKQIMNTLNPAWTGSIPVIYIYDGKGVQRKILQGLQSQAEIEENINELTN